MGHPDTRSARELCTKGSSWSTFVQEWFHHHINLNTLHAIRGQCKVLRTMYGLQEYSGRRIYQSIIPFMWHVLCLLAQQPQKPAQPHYALHSTEYSYTLCTSRSLTFAPLSELSSAPRLLQTCGQNLKSRSIDQMFSRDRSVLERKNGVPNPSKFGSRYLPTSESMPQQSIFMQAHRVNIWRKKFFHWPWKVISTLTVSFKRVSAGPT